MKRILIALLTTVAGAGLMSSVFAADLIVDEPAPVGVVDVSGNWDGVYVGVFAGYGWGSYQEIGDPDLDLSGWLVGVNLGADFTVSDGIVLGVVGDIAWSDVGLVDGIYSYNVDWVGSLRGRLGFDGGAFLPYLTAGLAVAGASAEAIFSDSQTHIGWTVGAGVEFAVSEDLSLDLLYRYSDYGSQTYDVGFGDYDASFTTHAVTVGLNWRF